MPESLRGMVYLIVNYTLGRIYTDLRQKTTEFIWWTNAVTFKYRTAPIR